MSLSGIAGSLVEAWAELRTHKTRILLALVGVALSVASLTTVVALADMSREAMEQGAEATSGRPATLAVSAWPMDGAAPDHGSVRPTGSAWRRPSS